jgi:hypothetical protein
MPQHSTLNHSSSSRHDPTKADDLSTSLNGNLSEITSIFGGADQLRTAFNQLQSLLYAA